MALSRGRQVGGVGGGLGQQQCGGQGVEPWHPNEAQEEPRPSTLREDGRQEERRCACRLPPLPPAMATHGGLWWHFPQRLTASWESPGPVPGPENGIRIPRFTSLCLLSQALPQAAGWGPAQGPSCLCAWSAPPSPGPLVQPGRLRLQELASRGLLHSAPPSVTPADVPMVIPQHFVSPPRPPALSSWWVPASTASTSCDLIDPPE